MKKELLCPTCGDDGLAQILRRTELAKIKPEWTFPCPNCLEFARVTPERTLRKVTREERVAIMTHPETRAAVEQFVALARDFRRVRDEWMRMMDR